MNRVNAFPLLAALLLALAFSCRNAPPEQQQAPESGALPEEVQRAYLEKGKAIATAAFAELSGRLAGALEEGGVNYAIQYCNMAAYPLIDSLSRVHQATIRRTSLKLRNPNNRPSEAERAMLMQYQEQADAGQELQPAVRKLDGQAIAFFAPIRVQPLCLQCHGKVGQDLSEADDALLKALYASDEATGYAAGDLRGTWSITFEQGE